MAKKKASKVRSKKISTALARVPVVVTTEYRGVFFGFIDPATVNDRTLTLENVRNCLRWDAAIGGFMGLAAIGPSRDCKIGTQAPRAVLHGITCVMSCTEAATAAWQSA